MSQQSALSGKPDSQGFFGAYGGQYVPEPVRARLDELAGAFDAALNDASFQRELEYLFVHYTGRPSRCSTAPISAACWAGPGSGSSARI